MRYTGAEPSVLVRKRLNDQGAKGLRHLGGIMGQPVWGATHEFVKSLCPTEGAGGEVYLAVKRKAGGPGVDGQSLGNVDADLTNQRFMI